MRDEAKVPPSRLFDWDRVLPIAAPWLALLLATAVHFGLPAIAPIEVAWLGPSAPLLAVLAIVFACRLARLAASYQSLIVTLAIALSVASCCALTAAVQIGKRLPAAQHGTSVRVEGQVARAGHAACRAVSVSVAHHAGERPCSTSAPARHLVLG